MMAFRRADVEQTVKGRDARRGHVSEITEGDYGFGFQIAPRYGLELGADEIRKPGRAEIAELQSKIWLLPELVQVLDK
jgi:hypothetical protein